MQAAGWALLRDCETFGYAEEEAGRYIVQAIATLTTAREAERAALAFKADDAPTPTPEKWLGAASLTHPGPLLMAPLNRRRLQASPVQPPGVRWSPREDMPRDTLPAFTT